MLKNSYIGDDGAVVNKWIYSKDLFVEDIHFKKEWMSYKQIATKAMLVNISDAIAMNAKPKYALVGFVLPKDISFAEIQSLSKTLKKIASKYKIKLIGGDTTSGKKIVVSITIISKKRKHTLFRNNLKKGDLIAFSGDVGRVKKDFDKLMSKKKISKKSKFYRPNLKSEFIKKSAKYLRCGLDISDGLSKDLSRLCFLSKLGVKFKKNLNKNELCSAEEYEMLFAFKKKYKNIVKKIAKKTDTKVTIFAKAVDGKYKSICKEHHF